MNVRHDQMELVILHQPQRFRRALCLSDLHPFGRAVLDNERDSLAYDGLVIDDQNPVHNAPPSA